jgi:hypothetical protein
MVMALMRFGYKTELVPWRNGGPSVTIRWYRAPSGAKHFPFKHIFNPLGWDFAPWELGTPGEVWNAPIKWFNGATPPTAKGQRFFGDPQDFLLGAVYSPLMPITPKDPWGLAIGCAGVVNPIGGGDLDGARVPCQVQPFAQDLDGCGLIESISGGGDLDGGFVYPLQGSGGGDLDAGQESGYLVVHTVCTPAIAPTFLISEFTDPNVPPVFHGNYLMEAKPPYPHIWISGNPFTHPLFGWQFFCEPLLGGWVLAVQLESASFESAVPSGTGPPFLVQTFTFPAGSLAPLAITARVRQPTTFERVPAGGGDVDSGDSAVAQIWPGVDVDSGAVTIQTWVYGGDVDGGQLSPFHFLYGGDLDGGQLSPFHFLYGGDVDGGSLLDGNTIPALGGDLDGSGLQAGIGTACTPGFAPRNLFADIVNPNPSGPVTGTYPLTLGILGSDVWTYGYPPALGDWYFSFLCQHPLIMWGFTLHLPPNPPSIVFVPTGTAPPFSVGPAILMGTVFGPLPITITVHE